MPPKIDFELCNSCGICDERCPGDVIHMDTEKNQPMVCYPYECWHCGNCKIDCPTGAIKIVFPLYMLI
jgi:NAD-dependent dihydropyrimidine dehydrogenase PreA subunit